MKLLALLLVITACEHDPRYERHENRRPPAATVPPEKTVERPVVDEPPVAVVPPAPKIVPFDKRTHRHRATRARP